MAILGVLMALSFLYCVHRIASAAWSGITQAYQTLQCENTTMKSAQDSASAKTVKRITRIFPFLTDSAPGRRNLWLKAIVTLDGSTNQVIQSGGICNFPDKPTDDDCARAWHHEATELTAQLLLAGFDKAAISAAFAAFQAERASEVA